MLVFAGILTPSIGCRIRPHLRVNKVNIKTNGIAESQKTDSELDDFKERITEYTLANDVTIWYDMSTHFPRAFVPEPQYYMNCA